MMSEVTLTPRGAGELPAGGRSLRYDPMHELSGLGSDGGAPGSDDDNSLLLVERLERVLATTGERRRRVHVTAVSDGGDIRTPSSLRSSYKRATFGKVLFPTDSTLKRVQFTDIPSTPLTYRLSQVESREVTDRHTIEHVRAVELQALMLAVTEAHRDDALRHLRLQVQDNGALRVAFEDLRRTLPTAASEAQQDVARLGEEARRWRREAAASGQREYGLAWVVISQQEGYLRGGIELQERSLFDITMERMRSVVMRQAFAERESRMDGERAAAEDQTRRYMLDTQESALKRQHQTQSDAHTWLHEDTTEYLRLLQRSEEALIRAEANKQIELLKAELSLQKARMAAAEDERDAAEAKLRVLAANAVKEADLLRTTAGAAEYRCVLERQAALLAAESRDRCGLREEEGVERRHLHHLRTRAESLDAQTLSDQAAARAAKTEAELRAALDGARADTAALLRAQAEEHFEEKAALEAKAVDAAAEANVLRRLLKQAEVQQAVTVRQQEAEIGVLKYQVMQVLSCEAEVEKAYRDAVRGDERAARAMLRSERQALTAVLDKEKAVAERAAMEESLHLANKHAESRDRMNAALRARLGAAEDALAGKLDTLLTDFDDVSQQNSSLRREKGLMLHKMAKAEAKSEWISAKKSLLQTQDSGEVDAYRRELLALQDELDCAKRRPDVRSTSVQADSASPAAETRATEAQTEQCPTRAAATQVDCVPVKAVGVQAEPVPGPSRQAVAERFTQLAAASPSVQPPARAASPELAGNAPPPPAAGQARRLGIAAAAPPAVPPPVKTKAPPPTGPPCRGDGRLVPAPAVADDASWVDGRRAFVFDLAAGLGMVYGGDGRLWNEVGRVDEGGQAARKGVHAGMRITRVNGVPVANQHAIDAAVRGGGSKARLEFSQTPARPPSPPADPPPTGSQSDDTPNPPPAPRGPGVLRAADDLQSKPRAHVAEPAKSEADSDEVEEIDLRGEDETIDELPPAIVNDFDLDTDEEKEMNSILQEQAKLEAAAQKKRQQVLAPKQSNKPAAAKVEKPPSQKKGSNNFDDDDDDDSDSELQRPVRRGRRSSFDNSESDDE